MIAGLTAAQFTFLHVIVSFLGIAFGLIVMGGLVQGRQSGFWTALFSSLGALCFLGVLALLSVVSWGIIFYKWLSFRKVASQSASS